jgi:uncharacterized protein (DUF2336 family)
LPMRRSTHCQRTLSTGAGAAALPRSSAGIVDTLRRITNLFLSGSNQFNDEQIGLFDDVLTQLINRIEAKALHELSAQLANVATAPINVIRQLANHDEIIVAGPVLANSYRLTNSDLVEISKTKSQAHLLAISGRTQLDESVTDILTERGNNEVVHKLANNAGAHFSDIGLETLSKRAEDEAFAKGDRGSAISSAGHRQS